MKKETIKKIVPLVMEAIYKSKIDTTDKTELMIILGKFLETYNYEEYSQMLYGKRMVKKR